MASILGTTLGDLYQSAVDEFLDENARRLHETRILRRRLGISEQYELTMRPRTGDDVHAVVSASPVRDPAGNVIGVLKMVTDITARRRAEEENERLALHDSLTGLGNRVSRARRHYVISHSCSIPRKRSRRRTAAAMAA